MGAPSKRFVARAVEGVGWRIWDRQQRRWWGNCSAGHPAALLIELNGEKRPDQLARLGRDGFTAPRAGKERRARNGR